MTKEQQNSLQEFLNLLKDAEAIELKDIKLNGGDIEFDIDLSQSAGNISPAFLQILQTLSAVAPYTVQAMQKLQTAIYETPPP